MNYELFMGEALAEAELAIERGERPIAAVAVVAVFAVTAEPPDGF